MNMATATSDYAAKLEPLEREILQILRSFETIQESLKLGDIKESQAKLVSVTGGTLRRFASEFAPIEPPETLREFHTALVEAVAQLEKSNNFFMTTPSRDWTMAFLYSRNAFCRALYTLYSIREHLPVISQYFAIEGAEHIAANAPPSGAQNGAATGFSHSERDATRGAYSLYVPENYSPDRQWPLIICLHGGYGAGKEYIWTWLRSARTKGYILVSPKSIAETWTMTMGSPDNRSVMKMLDEVEEKYSVDRSRIYLTGLSDGGIFTYIMGLERHEIFAGIAPVAGALHMAADPMLRTGTGKELPIFVIHGVHDFIFPVTFTRQTNDLLKQLGYDLKYEELPDWGHAFPYSINERLVLPWFEGLPPRQID
jgi:phospholipase/carboxylesterase